MIRISHYSPTLTPQTMHKKPQPNSSPRFSGLEEKDVKDVKDFFAELKNWKSNPPTRQSELLKVQQKAKQWADSIHLMETDKTQAWAYTLDTRVSDINDLKALLKRQQVWNVEIKEWLDARSNVFGVIGGTLGAASEGAALTATLGGTIAFVGSITAAAAGAGKYLGKKLLENFNADWKHHQDSLAACDQLSHIIQTLEQREKRSRHLYTQMLEIEKKAKPLLPPETVLSQLSHRFNHKTVAPDVDAIITQADKNILTESKEAPFLQVRNRRDDLLKQLNRIPGFLYEESKRSQRIPRYVTLLKDPASSIEDVLEALSKLHVEEPIIMGKWENSKLLYPSVYNKRKEAELKAAVLLAMIDNPMIRPEHYEQLLVESLLHPEELVKISAMAGLKYTPVKSSAVNVELDRIQALECGYSKEAREFAEKMIRLREKQGIGTIFNHETAARQIMNGIVGNRKLEKNLTSILGIYKAKLREMTNQSANICLYLPGEPGIGKTSLVTRIANVFGPESLVKIDMRSIQSVKQIKAILNQHTPLLGKVIFLDEFHTLGGQGITPEAREEILSYISPIIGGEPTDLSFKDTIVAIACNEPVDETPAFTSHNAKRTVNRIVNAWPIELETDMKPYIDEYVDKFEQQVFTTDFFSELGGAVSQGALTLDDSAKAYFKKLLKDKFKKKVIDVPGRNLLTPIAQKINAAMVDINQVFEANRQYIVSFDASKKDIVVHSK